MALSIWKNILNISKFQNKEKLNIIIWKSIKKTPGLEVILKYFCSPKILEEDSKSRVISWYMFKVENVFEQWIFDLTKWFISDYEPFWYFECIRVKIWCKIAMNQSINFHAQVLVYVFVVRSNKAWNMIVSKTLDSRSDLVTIYSNILFTFLLCD